MDLPSSSTPSSSAPKTSWLERLSHFLRRLPENQDDLVALLHVGFQRQLFDAEALSMLEGVLQVAEMQVRDVMIPRAQVDLIDIHTEPQQFIPLIIESGHSRFPVYDGNKDNVVGILLAKELLRYDASKDAKDSNEKFDMRTLLRPAIFIPESKRLNVLLKEFRANRNHMAIVVDEYGSVAGIVTIEDVVEQIVGDIEDEYDFDETEDNILLQHPGSWRVKAMTPLEDLNAALGSNFVDDDINTVGGLVLSHFGHMPKRGETIQIDNFRCQIIHADSRRIHTLLIEQLPAPTA